MSVSPNTPPYPHDPYEINVAQPGEPSVSNQKFNVEPLDNGEDDELTAIASQLFGPLSPTHPEPATPPVAFSGRAEPSNQFSRPWEHSTSASSPGPAAELPSMQPWNRPEWDNQSETSQSPTEARPAPISANRPPVTYGPAADPNLIHDDTARRLVPMDEYYGTSPIPAATPGTIGGPTEQRYDLFGSTRRNPNDNAGNPGQPDPASELPGRPFVPPDQRTIPARPQPQPSGPARQNTPTQPNSPKQPPQPTAPLVAPPPSPNQGGNTPPNPPQAKHAAPPPPPPPPQRIAITDPTISRPWTPIPADAPPLPGTIPPTPAGNNPDYDFQAWWDTPRLDAKTGQPLLHGGLPNIASNEQFYEGEQVYYPRPKRPMPSPDLRRYTGREAPLATQPLVGPPIDYSEAIANDYAIKPKNATPKDGNLARHLPRIPRPVQWTSAATIGLAGIYPELYYAGEVPGGTIAKVASAAGMLALDFIGFKLLRRGIDSHAAHHSGSTLTRSETRQRGEQARVTQRQADQTEINRISSDYGITTGRRVRQRRLFRRDR